MNNSAMAMNIALAQPNIHPGPQAAFQNPPQPQTQTRVPAFLNKLYA
jgi:hypothetical protein